MRVSQAEMDANHQRIVEGASRLLRERGVHNTSVADAMSEAGLTHGGFYRHFKTKDDLVVAGIQSTFDAIAAHLELQQLGADARDVVAEYRAIYLSQEHVDNPGQGCPVPALGGEVARESPALREAFGSGFRRVAGALATGMPGTPPERQSRALRELAMLVGAVVVARASDTETARLMLEACRGSENDAAPGDRGDGARE